MEKKHELKKLTGLAVTTLALNLSILGDVNAASVDVKCEVRSGRSKISVDGAGYGAGLYRSSVKSGTATVWSKVFKRPAAGEVQYDYDTNPADVRAGATYVPPTYIKGRTVYGNLYSYNSATRKYTLRASVREICKAR